MMGVMFDTLINAFTMPAVANSIAVAVETPANYAIGMWVYIVGIGYLEVTSVGATTITLKNTGNSSNAAPGVSVSDGTVMIPGFPKANADEALRPLDVLTAPFVTVANTATVNIEIQDNSWVAVGMTLYIKGAGKMLVTAVNMDGVTVTVQNGKTLNTKNANAGTTIASGTAVFACDDFPYTT